MKNLYIRTSLSVIGTIMYFWAFLFIPAGSVFFWQAWIFWGIFSVLVIIISIYFLKKNPSFMESRLRAGPIAEKEKDQKIIQLFTSLFFLMLLIIPGLDFRFHWSIVPIPLVFVGDVFILLGFWIVFLVFKENSFASATIQIGKGQKVISTGPYSLIRHPMYAGASFLVGAVPFALGSYWALLCLVPMALGVVLRLLREEKYLSKNLPGYMEYCKKVRYHLIPIIW